MVQYVIFTGTVLASAGNGHCLSGNGCLFKADLSHSQSCAIAAVTGLLPAIPIPSIGFTGIFSFQLSKLGSHGGIAAR